MFCFVVLSLLFIILHTVLDALVLVTHQDGTTCQMENTFVMLASITCIAGMSICALLQKEMSP